MPAERHISDLASFRYIPAKRASKTHLDGERMTDSDNASLRLQEATTDFSKCKLAFPYKKNITTYLRLIRRRHLLSHVALGARRVSHRGRQARPTAPLGRL